ncbi:AraC family transcriptional regulator [Kiritimatiellota bacterium B12222]|nr:AraC family transcriptional regulator [Kiritimatiellota bacterium B12222]
MDKPLAQITTHQVNNPEELVHAIRSATFEPCLLERTDNATYLSRAVLPETCIDFVTLGSSFLFKGILPSTCFTLVFILDCPRQGKSFNFGVEHQGGYMAFFPPGAPLDAYIPVGYSNATLTVPQDLFLKTVACMFPEIPESIIKTGAGVQVKKSSPLALRRLLAEVKSGLVDMGAPFASHAARAELESQLLIGFLSVLSDAVAGEGPRLKPRTENTEKRLRQARDFLRETITHPIHLDELCQELGMSRRGVEMMFRKSFNTTPGTYLQRQRLNGVRRDLMVSNAHSVSIREIANKWGILHMGHFSRNYRDLFGESPSTTLRRG